MNSTSHYRYAKRSTNAASSVCRLRHQLNSDCQLKIFEYLNVNELSAVCKVDKYFYDLITSELIPKKLIVIEELDGQFRNNRLAVNRATIETLHMFGKFINKMAVRGEDFGIFLKTVMQYCKPDCLTEIHLEFTLNSAAENLIDQSMPFFKKLRKMRLFDLNEEGLYQLFLTKIADAENKVEVLHLQQVDIVDGWLPKMQNLTQLRVHNQMDISNIDDLTGCFKSNPKLKLFEYKGNENLLETYKTLAACCPRLQTFNDFHLSNRGCGTEADVSRRYEFLSEFKALKSVMLTSYTESGLDLDHHLRKSALSSISKFRVYMNSDLPIVWSNERTKQFNTSFDKLKTIEIEIQSFGEKNCDLRCKFMFHLISQSENVENVKFIGKSFTNVQSLLHHTSNIQRLSIADVNFHPAQFQNELSSLMWALGSFSLCHPFEAPAQKIRIFHLGVNEHQWGKIKLFEKMRHIVTASIEKNVQKYVSL